MPSSILSGFLERVHGCDCAMALELLNRLPVGSLPAPTSLDPDIHSASFAAGADS